MKRGLLSLILAILFVAPAYADADEFDGHLRVCRDAVAEIKEFEALPNAAFYVYKGGYGDKSFYAYWIVDWDELQAAGKCLMDRKSPTINKITDFRKK